TLAAFAFKTFSFIFLFMWVRWTLPRFRYDQLMSLGWKVFLPGSLAYLVVVAGLSLALDYAGVGRGPLFGLILFGVNLVLVVGLAVLVDRGRLVSPAYSRLDERRVAALQARIPAVQEGGD